MKCFVLLAFVLSVPCSAEFPPVEGELGPTPTAVPGWDKPARKSVAPRDDTYGKWHFKFITASDKQLGSPKEIAKIRSELPIPDPTIRWLSRSLVVAAGANRLYVLERHHSKWEMTHRFEGLVFPPPAIRD